MRRLVLFTLLLFLVALPATAFATSTDDATLSVRNGLGLVKLNFSGSAVGRVAHGRITVNDPVDGDGLGPVFWNCDQKRTDLTTTVCSGDNIRFRAIGGKYSIVVRGSGLTLSAVGRGSAVLNGDGEAPDVSYDGVYSLNDQPYRSLPNEPKQLDLAAPAGG
jgi:hypothetical protein